VTKYIVRQRSGMFYKNFTEGNQVWTSRPTLFDEEVAREVAKQLVGLGYAASVQSYDEFDRERKAKRT